MLASRASRTAKHLSRSSRAGRGVVPRQFSQDAELVKANLAKVQSAVTEKLVPWFVTNMPYSYFRQVDEESQSGHLRTLAAHFDHAKGSFSKEAGRIQHEGINSLGQREVTFIQFGGAHSGLLAEQVESLHITEPLSRVKVFTSEDGALGFNIFTFGEPNASKTGTVHGTDDTGAQVILDYAKTLEDAHNAGEKLPDHMEWSPIYEHDSLQRFMDVCTERHVVHSRPRSFLHQARLYNEVRGTENVAVHVERNNAEGAATDAPQHWIKIAETNVVPQAALSRVLSYLTNRNMTVNRVHLDVVHEGADRAVMMRVLVTNPGNFDHLEREIKRLKWADEKSLQLAYHNAAHREVGIIHCEIITALLAISQPILSKLNPFTFSKTNVERTLSNPRNFRIASQIAEVYAERFNPKSPLGDAEFNAKLDGLRAHITANVEEYIENKVLRTMVDALEGTMRTNLFMRNRYALSLRVDPRLFRPVNDPDVAWNDPSLDTSNPWVVPYGVFFSHGRRFNGFHVRFRDIARGGLRLVTPSNVSQHAIESGRHFQEAYDLAFGQQLKNKDIPEGGSKCVALCDVTDEFGNVVPKEYREVILRKTVKAFSDSLLDLIVDTPETNNLVVDYFGKRELLYLGPDEQVIPDDINWIVKRAAERKYPIPSAFMSSKPDAGINHKVYGVTSEGVLVFLDEALKHVNLHPLDPERTKPVTIKMTGGPGGDVAGNMIRLLNDAYGDKVSIVGLCDGSGSLEDPKGLNTQELLRLFHEGLDVNHYNTTKLSNEGQLHLAHTEEGARARNTMHNRLVADAFIPAGGRPGTIDETNWRQFLQPNGEPSAKVIVEGANVFLTAAARKRLFDECKLPIVKDSSANKCGVICSSYEIMSSMLLSEQEFKANKEEIVASVLERLRDLARKEARMMFSEFQTRPGALPHFSQAISDAINRLTDAISARLTETEAHLDKNHPLAALVRRHLPSKLEELAGDRVYERVPPEYIKCIVSSALASRIVYREGTMFIEEQDENRLADIAFNYLESEKQVEEVLTAMEQADWFDRDEAKALAKKIVETGGVRALQK